LGRFGAISSISSAAKLTVAIFASVSPGIPDDSNMRTTTGFASA